MKRLRYGFPILVLFALSACAFAPDPGPEARAAADQLAADIDRKQRQYAGEADRAQPDVKLFARVFERVKSEYVRPVDEDILLAAASHALNDALRVYACQSEPTGAAPSSLDSLVSVDQPNVVIETVKQAEDGNGLIVRLYECMRQRGEVTLRCGVGITAVSTTNLLEENETELPHNGSSVTFLIKPYQIVTLRIGIN